jgi:hypothetical protein
MKLMKVLLLLLVLIPLATAYAQEERYRLAGADLVEEAGAWLLRYEGHELRYLPGVGWLGDDLGAAPTRVAGNVYVSAATLAALGVERPRLERVRSSRGDAVRLVFDISGLPTRTPLEQLAQEGVLAAGEPLQLRLPRLLLPLEPASGVPGIELSVREGLIRTEIDISGPAMHYRVFALDEPTRLVVDLTPHEPLPAAPTVSAPPGPLPPSEVAEAALDAADARWLEPFDLSPPVASRPLHPAVIHRELRVPVPGGTSRVDILEIDPSYGEFRVVGESFVPRTLSQLSDGGLAAINASYFDTRNHLSIGFLRIDHTLLSLPSRNRASIGFGVGRPIIDRVAVDLSVRVNGRAAFQGIVTENEVVVHTSAGYLVGSPTRGALVVEQGRVVENKIGPRRVPEGGFVLVYEPDIRELALADEGDLLSYSARFVPDAFNRVRYAVEAGPLLVQGGRPAYAPDLEAFDVVNPESNVNRRTTRAAVGVREDGTVLFVTATNMTASELVPLFLSLGAVDALQMDSGGSSTLVAKGQVINRPASSQRQIATAIVFVPHR